MGLFSCFAKPRTEESPPSALASRAAPHELSLPLGAGVPKSLAAPAVASLPLLAPVPSGTTRTVKSVTLKLPDDDDTDLDVPATRGIDQTPRKVKSALKVANSSTQMQDAQPDQSDVATDTCGVPDSPARFKPDAVKNLSTVLQGPAEFAAVLRPFTQEASDAPVHSYIAALGGKHSGAGLAEAAAHDAAAGRLFGAAYKLSAVATAALVNRENVLKLSAMGQDLLRAVDAAGQKGAVPTAALEALEQQLQRSIETAAVFAKEGWLLHMACNESIKPEFDRCHNAIAEELEAVGLARGLPRGDYYDANRNLRRTLKRIGAGNIAQGIKSLGADPQSDSVREVATQLGVAPEAVARELAALPADVNAEGYYARMVQRGAQPASQQYGAVFEWYNKSRSGQLDRAELRAVLADLGVFEGLRPAEVEARLGDAFSLADQDGDGRVGLNEFARYYDTLTFSNTRKQLRLAVGLQGEEDLKSVFLTWSGFGTRQVVEDMDSAHFCKLFRDCGLVGKDLTVTDIDLAFTRAKPKGARRLGFDAFLAALAECADRRGSSLEGMVRALLACEGPIARATKTDNVRLHDDKSTYTGVYAKGGPKVAQRSNDLAALLDRSEAGAAKKTPVRAPRAAQTTVVPQAADRGAVQAPQQPPMSMSMQLPAGGGGRSGAWLRRSTVGGAGGPADAASLHLYEMWLMWAQFGLGSAAAHAGGAGAKAEMGEAQFVKLLRETGLLDRAFGSVQADLIFARAKPKGAGKLSFEAFEKALSLIAEAKGLPRQQVVEAILASDGPMLTPHKA